VDGVEGGEVYENSVADERVVVQVRIEIELTRYPRGV
jgi:hypothetical protein